MSLLPGSPTVGRDGYYQYIFQLLVDSRKSGGVFAGCNFWGWGGESQPNHVEWQAGDDYCCDPAQENQGLNSVFDCDTATINIIKKHNRQ
jgi:mannan endo-1,4-beta-mannosidase